MFLRKWASLPDERMARTDDCSVVVVWPGKIMNSSLLAWVADASNPLQLLVFLYWVFTRAPSGSAAGRFLGRFGFALAITYVGSHMHQWFGWWKDLGDLPSGHMTFFLTVSTSFFVFNPRSLIFTLPFAVGYGWLIVYLGYHSWLDLLAALALAVPVTLVCHHWGKKFHLAGKRPSL